MPLLRYFIVTGSMLLGLLFLADWYLPLSSVTASTYNEVDRSIIRIHSSRKWPDAINIDTRMPIIVPRAVIADATPFSAPAEPVRQAYAYAALPSQKTSEKIRRRLKSATKPASVREPVPNFANYQPWDSRNW